MMEVTLTCESCGSAIDIVPTVAANVAKCQICQHEQEIHFNDDHLESLLKDCPYCLRKDFYSQKDFNRKIGVFLFVVAAVLSIWTYGLSFIVLYIFDFALFKRLRPVAICYNCNAVFRKVANILDIGVYDHEMNDRIVYSGHDFEGKPLDDRH